MLHSDDRGGLAKVQVSHAQCSLMFSTRLSFHEMVHTTFFLSFFLVYFTLECMLVHVSPSRTAQLQRRETTQGLPYNGSPTRTAHAGDQAR